MLVAGATLALVSVALAAATAYHTGVYSGTTSQSHGMAIKITRGEMTDMVYYANYQCTDLANGKPGTYSNVQNELPAAPISHQTVHATYHLKHGTDVVKLYVALQRHGVTGWFKQTWHPTYHGMPLVCHTGGKGTTAGKVSFSAIR